MLMVGVIPAKLGAAGRADERYGEFSETGRKTAKYTAVAFHLQRFAILPIQKLKRGSCLPAQKNMLPNGACFELQG